MNELAELTLKFDISCEGDPKFKDTIPMSSNEILEIIHNTPKNSKSKKVIESAIHTNVLKKVRESGNLVSRIRITDNRITINLDNGWCDALWASDLIQITDDKIELTELGIKQLKEYIVGKNKR